MRDLRAIRNVELSQHVAVIGNAVAPFLDTDPAALRAEDSLEILPMIRRWPRPAGSPGSRSAGACPKRSRQQGLR